jgi:hypothetical protein
MPSTVFRSHICAIHLSRHGKACQGQNPFGPDFPIDIGKGAALPFGNLDGTLLLSKWGQNKPVSERLGPCGRTRDGGNPMVIGLAYRLPSGVLMHIIPVRRAGGMLFLRHNTLLGDEIVFH